LPFNLINIFTEQIDGGIHAREWISPAAVLFMIDQLVTGYDSQPMIRQLVDQLDWYIVPLLNPDGLIHKGPSLALNAFLKLFLF
jgi:murein tripeptide amidase MpaA